MYAEDPLPEFYKVVDTLLRWAPEIFAFHKAGRISNGRLEGTNNKLGVLKRMAFGFVNASNFEARGLLLCPAPAGAPPEPPSPRNRAVSASRSNSQASGSHCGSRSDGLRNLSNCVHDCGIKPAPYRHYTPRAMLANLV